LKEFVMIYKRIPFSIPAGQPLRRILTNLLTVIFFLSLKTAAHATPVITGVTALSVTATDVWIQWTTDVSADEQVDYGPALPYANSTSLPTYPAAAFRGHLVHLTGLSVSTLYHFRARSQDGTGSTASPDMTFTTFALPGTGHLQGGILKDDNGNGVFDTGENYIIDPLAPPCPNNDFPQAGITVSFSAAPGAPVIGAAASPTVCDATTGRPIYSVDLPPGQYIAKLSKPILGGWTITSPDNMPITVTDGGSQVISFALQPPQTNNPPVISGVASYQIGSSSAAIEWTTDQESDGEVDYGTTVAYGNIALQPALALLRVITLTGLTPNTLYHYQVKSKNATGNLATSGDFTFTTLPPGLAPCDLNGDGSINVADLQLEVNMTIGVAPCTVDINNDGVCNVIDVMRVMNAALGGQCVSP
jgi:hypothetical protein